ncbi:conserved unknown protein [Ectocarpus siliculosus]|uniref:ER lumen protein-retaining receptor n=1 Tax=Ectocarpus siliculosus TaxID=2880 RepID=D7FRR1_ECTSI|nr:conserved unknown protein [Ectocarpus siliculosus]|eukprot:CBJ30852.1 conserved unknown protein [Ectocarpus siliculosus]
MMNIFEFLGDMSHLAATVLLPYKLHTSRSAAGVSLKMQELYMVVFLTRYSDLLYVFSSWYNSVMKIAHIFLTGLTIGMLKSRPSLKASYDASLHYYLPGVLRFAWNFSEVLEPLAVVPQLLVFRGSTDAGRLGWTYVTLMGAYRALYILNWVYLSYNDYAYRHHPLVYAAGIVQTGMYLMFLVDRRVRCARDSLRGVGVSCTL